MGRSYVLYCLQVYSPEMKNSHWCKLGGVLFSARSKIHGSKGSYNAALGRLKRSVVCTRLDLVVFVTIRLPQLLETSRRTLRGPGAASVSTILLAVNSSRQEATKSTGHFSREQPTPHS